MKVKTSELTGAALDWAVAKCEGWESGKYMMSPDIRKDVNGKVIGIMVPKNHEYMWFKPSTDWAQGGPIIEREGIELLCNLTETEAARFKSANADWQAFYRQRRATEQRSYATTPLIAAMRCYCCSELGNEVEVPDELTN